MDRLSGKSLEGDAHLAQSIADILLTPIGSRVMRRDYGSLLPTLLDEPMNTRTVLRLYAATAGALRKWEPRLRLVRCSLRRVADGAAELLLEGFRTDSAPPNSLTTLTVPLSVRG